MAPRRDGLSALIFYDMSETTEEKLPEVEAWNWLVGLLSKRDWLVVGWVLAIKALLFLFGAKSYQTLAVGLALDRDFARRIWSVFAR
jgi:hypothetical protein